MQSLVGIFRTEEDLRRARGELEKLKERAARVSVEGSRMFNPGWHLAQDLKAMLTVSDLMSSEWPLMMSSLAPVSIPRSPFGAPEMTDPPIVTDPVETLDVVVAPPTVSPPWIVTGPLVGTRVIDPDLISVEWPVITSSFWPVLITRSWFGLSPIV